MEVSNKFIQFKNQIISGLKQPLPGDLAHSKLMSYHRPKVSEIIHKGTHRESAVLALFYPINEEPHLVFILRQSYAGVHSSQVSFPGGKRELSDDSLVYTALREANEELSILQNEVEVIGSLSEIYVPPSNFLISPFVGFSSTRPNFLKDPREVAKIIEVRVADLVNHVNFTKTEVNLPNGTQMKVPAFLFNQQIIWGATAMMVQEIKEILAKS